MDKRKTKGHTASLDQRIAACIADDDGNATRSEISKLVEEAEATIAEARATAGTESANALNISNPDPDSSDALVRKATRTIARLNQALPKLRERIASIEAVEYAERWHADADVLESVRDRLATELRQFYPSVIERLSDIFARIDQNTEAISRLHATAPSTSWGENQRRLLDAELVARDLPNYDAAHPRLRDNIKLPAWDISRV